MIPSDAVEQLVPPPLLPTGNYCWWAETWLGLDEGAEEGVWLLQLVVVEGAEEVRQLLL